jgi:hypothetical protein
MGKTPHRARVTTEVVGGAGKQRPGGKGAEAGAEKAEGGSVSLLPPPCAAGPPPEDRAPVCEIAA